MALEQQMSERDKVPVGLPTRVLFPQSNIFIRAAKWLLITCTLLFVALQWLPRPPQTNPRVNPQETLEANVSVPAPVAAIIQRACANCHSHETHWPWYSRVAPLSWLMTSDVENARKSMNLSRWSIQNGRRPEVAIATLSAMCAGIESGRMPKENYLLLHPEARLSEKEKAEVCTWTKGEIRELVRKKREKSRGTFTKLLQSRHDSQPASFLPLIKK
jgi:hypothetical protein